eukprot:scaffold179642_cov24-Prasinocladus_malaysianus.AAC.2
MERQSSGKMLRVDAVDCASNWLCFLHAEAPWSFAITCVHSNKIRPRRLSKSENAVIFRVLKHWLHIHELVLVVTMVFLRPTA